MNGFGSELYSFEKWKSTDNLSIISHQSSRQKQQLIYGWAFGKQMHFASIRWILVEKSSVHCRIIVYSQLKLTAKEMERFVRSLGRFSRKKGKRMKGMPKDYYLYISPNIMGNLKETKWMGFVWKNCRKWKKRDTKNEAA